MQRKRKADHKESCSGGEHHAAKHSRKEESVAEPFTILFADIGRYDPSLEKILLPDDRASVKLSEVKECAKMFGADVQSIRRQ